MYGATAMSQSERGDASDPAESPTPHSTTLLSIGNVLLLSGEDSECGASAGSGATGRVVLVRRDHAASAIVWHSASAETTCRRVDVDVTDVASLRLSDGRLCCAVLLRDGSTAVRLQFVSKHDSQIFLDTLHELVPIERSCSDDQLYVVPSATSSPRKTGGGGRPMPHISAFTEHSLSGVWNFVRQLPRNPGTAVLTGLSKMADVLNVGALEEQRPPDELADVLRNVHLSSLDRAATRPPRLQSSDVEGFEVVTEIKLPAIAPQPRLAPLSTDELHRHFLPDIQLGPDDAALRQRVFDGGIEADLRPRLWRHLLGCERIDCDAQQSARQAAERRASYERMLCQWSSMNEQQLTRFSAMRERLVAVDKDVTRTDRSEPFYSGEHNQNVDTLRRVLMTYCMYNFDLGYVQGMSDLLSPILYVIRDEADSFWCFVGFMSRLADNFELTQQMMRRQFEHLHSVLHVLDPLFCGYLDHNAVSPMTLTFRWLLVWFKRELAWPDVLRLWEVLWTRVPCDNFVLLVAAAVLTQHRDVIMESKLTASAIVKYINELALNIQLDEALVLAYQIWRRFQSGDKVPAAVCRILGLHVTNTSQDDQARDYVARDYVARDYVARDDDKQTSVTSRHDVDSAEEADTLYETALSNNFF